ncbi:MAG TPA: hypothetical protein ENH82_03630 [bacterium]|nr:hypothetical protein [bacterium]
MRKLLFNLAGKKLGNWNVIKRDNNDKHRNIKWLCKCKCGKIYSVRSEQLRNGDSTQCRSCSNKIKGGWKTHGLTKSKLFKTWCGIVQRCENKNNEFYPRYGGRGIKICTLWRHDFKSFYDYAIANGWKEGLTIDRIDNDGNYEPGNIRFVPMKIQCRNRSSNIWITIKGETKILADWARINNIKYGTIHFRYKQGWRGENLIAPTKTIIRP